MISIIIYPAELKGLTTAISDFMRPLHSVGHYNISNWRYADTFM